MEFTNKHIFIMLHVFLFLFLVLFFVFFSGILNDKTSVDLLKDAHKKEYHKGYVVKKYIDVDNHAIPTIELNNSGDKITLSDNWFQIIEVRDSIIKNYDDTIYYLVKKDKVYKIDYLDWYLGNASKNQ